MQRGKQGWLCLAIIIVSGYAVTANAALINRGSGMIYDDVLDVTWLQDANYAKTTGFDFDGLLTWEQASTWVSNLVFGGYSDWRLPSVSPVNGTSFSTFYSFSGSSDRGYNTNPDFSELAHMFFNNLGNVAYFTPGGIGPQSGSDSFESNFIDGESGEIYSFENIGNVYWSGTVDDPFLNAAWAFNFKTNSGLSLGEQSLYNDASSLSVWALRDGDVASTLAAPDTNVAVSNPNTLGLLVFSLLGVIAARRETRV